jgi:hypothetical protein
MKGRRLLAVVPVLLLLFCGGLVAQDDLADYPIKEEQCENFGCASPPPLYARRPNANRAAGAVLASACRAAAARHRQRSAEALRRRAGRRRPSRR